MDVNNHLLVTRSIDWIFVETNPNPSLLVWEDRTVHQLKKN